MKIRTTTLTVLVAVGVGACGGETPVSPKLSVPEQVAFARRPGTGLALENLTGVTVPILGIPLGDVIIDQAIITDLKVIEDLAGNIVGLQAEGVLQLTGGVLGTTVLTQDFLTVVGITSDGPGQCDVVSINLGPIDVTRLDPLARVDVPAATVTARGSGAVGSLLCNLGALLNIPGRAIRGIVQALNNLI